MADNMSIDKNDPVRDESGDESGTSSSRDAEAQVNNTSAANSTQENQQPKRKGGRKPIYATSEERKQRNRQAQAAFRERRTEYIKQLEETIRVHETNLHNLQTAHRHAADECLMLRYKNSLLERILLEKQIDVQAELRAKTGSPNLGPSHMPPNLVQPPSIQRSLLNRHHSRRSNSAIAPKAEPGMPLAPLPAPLVSPHIHPTTGRAPPKANQPTPPSHAASPTGTGTISYGSQQAPSPATSGSEHMTGHVRHRMKAPPIPAPANMSNPLARHMQMSALQQPQQHQQQQRPGRGGVGAAPPYYATQAYQNHIEQLGKLTPFFSPLPVPLLIELCRPRFINCFRTGIRCRSRHDGRLRRAARYAQRTRSLSRCALWRRFAAHDAAFPGHDDAAKRTRSWSRRPWSLDVDGGCSAPTATTTAPTAPSAAAAAAASS